MAIQIISGNLNTYGNAGQFETDRSTWGFANGTFSAVRSSAQKTAGIYSALITKSSLSDTLLLPCRYFSELGKKYVLRAKVRVPSGLPVGGGGDVITMSASLDNISFTGTPANLVTTTVTEATDAWVDIECTIEHTAALFPALDNIQYIRVTGGTLNGQIFVDQFEVYEYIDVEEPDPEDPPPGDPDVNFDKVYFSKNPITRSAAAGSGWQDITNYRLYNDVRVEDVADSTTYTSKLKTELPPETNGTVEFHLAEAFRDVFNLAPPVADDAIIRRITGRIKRFKNFAGILTGTQSTPGSTTGGLTNLVLYGGINKQKYPGLNYFTSYLPTNKKFLTWAPTTKAVDLLMEDYLNFFIYDDFGTIKLVGKAYYDDDTTEQDILLTKANVFEGELYQVPAGPDNSGIKLLDPEKNLVKYELWLTDVANVIISEVRTYTIINDRHPRTRHFMFLNSLGTYEVLRFTGIANIKTTYNRQLTQQVLPANYAAVDGEYQTNNVTMQAVASYSSGHVNKAWHEYLRDFLLSERVYDVTDGLRLPVNITAGEHEEEDQNALRFIRFEARTAYTDSSFTPREI
jgi:hypothetical protein